MYSYLIFGLRVDSTDPIGGAILSSSETTPDVVYQLGSLPDRDATDAEVFFEEETFPGTNQPRLTVFRTKSGDYHLKYINGIEFFVDGRGARVWARWPDSYSPDDANLIFLGPVLGLVQRLRGRTSIHGSVINVGGKAAVFVGPSGAGKSTIAAAMALRGYPIISDDQAVLDETADGFQVFPGYRKIRLWPNSVEFLFGHQEALPQLSNNRKKRYMPLDDASASFQREPVHLGAIYFVAPRVGWDWAPKVESMLPSAALLRLVINAYVPHFVPREHRKAEFDRLGRLVQSLPAGLLTPHADPGRLPALCETIESDLERVFRVPSSA